MEGVKIIKPVPALEDELASDDVERKGRPEDRPSEERTLELLQRERELILKEQKVSLRESLSLPVQQLRRRRLIPIWEKR